MMFQRGPAVWPQASEEETAMEHYAGIDVSLEASSVCVVDGGGRILREAKVASERMRWRSSLAISAAR